MADVTLKLDAQHADIMRRQIAYKCGSEAETLYREADGYYIDAMSPRRKFNAQPGDEADISSFRTSMEKVQTWSGLLDAVGWDPADDTAGEYRTLVAPREQLQDLLLTGLQIAVERLDEIGRPGDEEGRASEVLRRRADEIEVYEDLLDRVGWPEPKAEEGGR